MARVPMVTRTIVTTKANVLTINTATGQTQNIEVVVPRTYKTDAKLLKAVQATITDENIKAVHIVSKEEVSTLYGMDEALFVQTAQILPDRK